MRILKLRFKNLNSLYGEWEIDFRDKKFINNGIFAIIGPTGSGKSTILDAITLALYGQTPRLEKITKSNNEIMSKGEWECFSEVLFEIKEKEYLVFWYQKKSKKDPHGNLQTPHHEISYNKKILEDKLRLVPEKVEEITGLDFEKMRRSMIIAQGSFDIFLKAKPNDRAPLLEEITGTEIYSKISIKVHERKNQIKQKVDLIEVSMKNIDILEEGEENNLIEELKNLEMKNKELEKDILRLEKIEDYLMQKDTIQNNLNTLKSKLEVIKVKEEKFEDKRVLIESIKKALTIENDYINLIKMENNLVQKIESREIQNRNLGILNEKIKKLNNEKDNLKEELNRLISFLKSQKTIFEKIKELDFEIKSKTLNLKKLKGICKEKENSFNILLKDIEYKTNRLKSYRASLKELEKKLLNNSDKNLKEELPLILEKLNNYKLENKKFHTLKMEEVKLEEEIKEFLQKIEKLENSINLLHKKKENIEDIKYKSKEKIDEFENIILIQEKINQKHNLKELLDEVLKDIDEGNLYLKDIEENRVLLEELKNLYEESFNSLNTLEDKLKELKEKKELLEENIKLKIEIQNFKKYRKYLIKGKPCPLCGSTTHPFVDNEPQIDIDKKRVESLQKEILNIDKMIKNNIEEKAKYEQSIKNLEKNLKNSKEKFDKLKNSFNKKIEKYNLPKDKKTLKEQKLILEKDLKNLSNKIYLIEEERKRLDKLEEELIVVIKNLNKENEKINSLTNKKSIFKQNLKNIKEQLKNIDLDSLKKDIEVILKQFKIEFNTLDINNLKNRVENYDKLSNNIKTLQLKIVSLESELKEKINQKESLYEEFNFKSKELSKNIKELKIAQDSRFNIFGDKDPIKEENFLNEKIEKLKKNLEDIEIKYKENKSNFDKSWAVINSLEKDIEHLNKEYKKFSFLFNNALKEKLSNKEEFLELISKKDKLKKLEEEYNNLIKQKEGLYTLVKDKEKKLYSLKEKLKDIDYSKVEDNLKEQKTLKDNLLKEIGAIKQKLDINKEAKNKYKSSLEELKFINQELHKWEKLDNLIGSHDGKKFRNFAQGLTFEIMIDYANEVLLKMSDRYYLIRDNKNPLELNVIDLYRANEFRSIKNLSGGESFIVSLALAIGLSNMVSGRISVDSLFLDEGFGTLDDETLDIALSTLSSLQSQGKLIGIISHIDKIKEQIFTKIELISNNGISKLIGAGVKNLD